MSKRARKTTLIFIFLTGLSLVLAGCSKPKNMQRAQQLEQVEKMTGTASETKGIHAIRRQALQDTASGLGAQGALSWRSQQINAMLKANARTLDQAFNFTPLMLRDDVLPPVLVQGDDSLKLSGPDTLRLAAKTYRIQLPPRFVTTPPNWRDYLWLDYQEPPTPSGTLLPKSDKERLVWNEYVKKGWQAGLDQADQIFATNLNRLKRDYEGMVLYRILLAQNMVSAPFVSKANLGVTGDANQIRINDRILRITATSKLNPNSEQWRAIVNQGDEPTPATTLRTAPATIPKPVK